MFAEREWDASCPREYARWEDGGVQWVVQDLLPEHDEEALAILQHHLLPDETMCRECGVSEDPESVAGILGIWRRCLAARTSLACYEERGSERALVGLNVCVVQAQGAAFPEDQISGSRCAAVFRTLMYIESLCDVFEATGEPRVLEALGLVVRREHRGRGLGGRILAAREQLCQALGVRATGTLFTSAASQALAARCGFRELAAVSLAELAAAGLPYPRDARTILYMAREYPPAPAAGGAAL